MNIMDLIIYRTLQLQFRNFVNLNNKIIKHAMNNEDFIIGK